VNEAYAVIKTLGYDRNGPILKLTEAMADGRLRFEQEMGRQSLILQRSSDLAGVELKAGDEVRIDSSLRIAIEKLADRKAAKHVLDEAPNVTWEQIGGQQEAIAAIRKAIEYPLLHASTFEQFKFSQPKGFLLYGPPGCGKTLIGQAAAASLSKLVSESAPDVHGTGDARAPITGGAFLHVKGLANRSAWCAICSCRREPSASRGHSHSSLSTKPSPSLGRGGPCGRSTSPIPWCRCFAAKWTASSPSVMSSLFWPRTGPI
jgi:proteasome-associated ATPase